MKTSSLAQRLEEFDAQIESLKLTQKPATRRLFQQPAAEAAGDPLRAARRAPRARSIRIRDQGLRPFRVC